MRIETTGQEWADIPPRHKWKLLDFLYSQSIDIRYDGDDGITFNIEVSRENYRIYG